MIEQVSGKLVSKSPTFCVIDCHGVGLGLHISLNTFQQLEKTPENEDVFLHAYLHVREDVLSLYGFAGMAEKELFHLLITVSGIGPRLAIAVLSGSTSGELRTAIAREDIAALIRIPGVGRKTAQRLVLELKEKIQKQGEIEKLVALSTASQKQRIKINEAILALTSLGYKQQEAQRAIDKLLKRSGDDITLEEMVKEALKEI